MTQRKLLLVSANRYIVPYPVYPIGLAFIMTYLESKMPEISIKLFDFNLNSNKEFIDLLKNYQPDYIGVSFRNVDNADSLSKENFISEYQEIIRNIKDNNKGTIIIGGAGFSIFPEVLFNLLQPQFGIIGEGEESLHELLRCLENNLEYKHIEGLVYRNEGKLMINKRDNFFRSLDLSFNTELLDFYWEKSGTLNVQTKRGCPYDCIYCSYPVIEGTKVRTLNTDKIVKTMSDLVLQKKINYVFFTDSIFNISNEYNIELANKIIDSGINIKWGAYFSPSNLTEESLSLYQKAGLKHIEFGTESMSGTTLKHYRKHFTVDDIVEISNICNKLGIYYAHFLILAGYGETEESIAETFENSKRITNSVFFPFIGMRIYPGTRLHEMAIQDGTISKEDDLIEPKYYISNKVDLTKLKDAARKTGKQWMFPDDKMPDVIEQMRIKKRKGPLWHLIR